MTQLPTGDQIFLDHIAHFVPEVEAARAALARAGFSTTPVSIQVNPDPAGGPARLTGTGNSTVMLSQGYLEVLFKTADTPIAGELETAMSRYRGVHLAALAVADAAASHRRIAAQGFRVRPLVRMQRPVDDDGREGTAAFTLARVEPGEMAEGRIQILTHHTERLVWQPRWLVHPNGARALRRLIIVVADIVEAADRFGRFTGRAAKPRRASAAIELDRGSIELVTVDRFREMLPQIAIPSLPFMGAYEIAVESLAKLRRVVEGAGLKMTPQPTGIGVAFPEEIGQGAWLFTE
jgi:hypothetical protein